MAIDAQAQRAGVRLKFLGGAREVTGAMILVETPSGSLLIDCGLWQGRREESQERNLELPRVARGVQAVLLTHAHLDHAGSLPTLVRQGFRGSIYSTPATRDLCAIMLRDSARMQANDAAYLNRRFASHQEYLPLLPLYDEADAIRALERFVGEPYRHTFEPLPGLSAKFLDSGHILGSAQVVLDVRHGKTRTRLVFSGDLGRPNMPMVRRPERPPGHPEYLIMESTYGDRAHEPLELTMNRLGQVIEQTVERRGKIIIPAFAIGRSQELVYALTRLYRAKRLPPIPIYVDSPLSVSVIEVFKLHPECFDQEIRASLRDPGDVFGFEQIHYVQSRNDSIALNQLEGPAIIISATGMAEGGRVLHHLQNAVEDERNTILMVGFMAQHTLGRRLLEGEPRVRIFGREYEVRARIEAMDGFSAHADRSDLVHYALAVAPRAGVFLVHGEPAQQGPLRVALESVGQKVFVPARGESFKL